MTSPESCDDALPTLATVRVVGCRWDVQESTCMWKVPDVEGRTGRCWELKGETEGEKKNPGKEVSKHRQKATRWVTHWNGKGRRARERGGEGGGSPHTQIEPDFGSGSCKRETARGEGRDVSDGTTERKNITCYMGRWERKKTERIFGVLTTVLA